MTITAKFATVAIICFAIGSTLGLARWAAAPLLGPNESGMPFGVAVQLADADGALGVAQVGPDSFRPTTWAEDRAADLGAGK